MSDRCYMTIECRACDVERFEDLGFLGCGVNPDKTNNRHDIHMLEEAEGCPSIFFDLGQPGKLPKDIPYLATHAEGYEYGPHILACDGKEVAEAESDWDRTMPVVRWDMKANAADAEDVKTAMNYTRVAALVERRFALEHVRDGLVQQMHDQQQGIAGLIGEED